jgi:hypothetical protein
MDLGLAQLADDVEGRLTRTRQFVGTLRYASPEQVLAVGQPDPRTDVYTLGATLYEMLTLRPLYGATEQTPTPELMQRIQYQEPEPPPRHRPGIPADLEAIVLKCLEKDPKRRSPTARELADDLGRFLRDEPVLARPPSALYQLGKFAKRHKAVAAGVAAVFVALADAPSGPGQVLPALSLDEPPLRRALRNTRALGGLGKVSPEQAQFLAGIASAGRDPDLARWIVGAWERQAPQDVNAWRARAQVELRAGAYGPAPRAADKVLAVKPDDRPALDCRGEAVGLLRKQAEQLDR